MATVLSWEVFKRQGHRFVDILGDFEADGRMKLVGLLPMPRDLKERRKWYGRCETYWTDPNDGIIPNRCREWAADKILEKIAKRKAKEEKKARELDATNR